MPTGYSNLTGLNPFKGKRRKSFTKEHKLKMSLSSKGKVPWNKNKVGLQKMSLETREKMSLSAKRRVLEGRHPNFNGWITPLYHQIRTCFKYRQWRSDVFTRDNFTCQECGKKGGTLNSHHIKEFNIIIRENNIKKLEQALNCEELWNINNGITLCKECHNLTKNGNQKN